MPFIHIRSLPFEEGLDIPGILTGIARDFAGKTKIAARHVHVTWAYLEPGHYARGDQAPPRQPPSAHPLIVDLLVPDFNDDEIIALMLKTLADSISHRAPCAKNNIFINLRRARSGCVFDEGRIESW